MSVKKIFCYVVTLFMMMYASMTNASHDVFHYKGDPVVGNPKGKVTLVEFFDYQCGYCVAMVPIIDSLIQQNPNLRVIFKEYPIRGDASEFAARAALAANQQHKYYPFSHALLTAHQPITPDFIYEIARKVGVNVKTLKKTMNSSRITQQLRDNATLAQRYGITGTPAFLIGESNSKDTSQVRLLLGAVSQSELQRTIDRFNS